MNSSASLALTNLARIGQLKPEQPGCAGKGRLAALGNGTATLRQHGYRSDNRYLVFQTLEHTLSFKPQQWLLLNQAHKKRNLAEYEGELDVTEGFVHELIEHVGQLLAVAQALAIEPPA